MAEYQRGDSPPGTKAGEPVSWCTHVRRDNGGQHVHGTNAAYGYCRCRCAVCRKTHADINRNRERAHLYGRYDRLVPADPVRAHVRALGAAGIGRRRVCELAGIPQSTMSNMLMGHPRVPELPVRVSKDVAEKIMAIPLPSTELELTAGGSRVSPVGTQRRLRALVASGWSQRELSRQLDAQRGGIKDAINDMLWLRVRQAVTAGTARSVHQLYLQLQDKTPPPSVGVARARNLAAKHGWVGPEGWLDVDIDDPAARPWRPEDDVDGVDLELVEDVVAGRTPIVALSGPDRLEACARLLQLPGVGVMQAAARAGLEQKEAERIFKALERGASPHRGPVIYYRDGIQLAGPEVDLDVVDALIEGADPAGQPAHVLVEVFARRYAAGGISARDLSKQLGLTEGEAFRIARAVNQGSDPHQTPVERVRGGIPVDDVDAPEQRRSA